MSSLMRVNIDECCGPMARPKRIPNQSDKDAALRMLSAICAHEKQLPHGGNYTLADFMLERDKARKGKRQ